MVVNTNSENNFVEIPAFTNIEHDRTKTPDILFDVPVESEEKLEPFTDEEHAEIEYTLEHRNRFVL